MKLNNNKTLNIYIQLQSTQSVNQTFCFLCMKIRFTIVTSLSFPSDGFNVVACCILSSSFNSFQHIQSSNISLYVYLNLFFFIVFYVVNTYREKRASKQTKKPRIGKETSRWKDKRTKSTVCMCIVKWDMAAVRFD